MDLLIAISCREDSLRLEETLSELSRQDGIEITDIVLMNHDLEGNLPESLESLEKKYPELNLSIENVSRTFLVLNDILSKKVEDGYILFMNDQVEFNSKSYLRDLINEVSNKDAKIATTPLNPPLNKLGLKYGYWIYNNMLRFFGFKNCVVHSSFFIVHSSKLLEYQFPKTYEINDLHIKFSNCNTGEFYITNSGISKSIDKFISKSYKDYIESIKTITN